MATIGQALTSPESSWQRIGFNNTSFTYVGSWGVSGTYKYTSNIGNTLTFGFTGTKLRLIGQKDSTVANRCDNMEVKIDGVVVSNINEYGATTIEKALLFEQTNLSNEKHTVVLTHKGSTGLAFMFDSIDIDSNEAMVTAPTGQALTVAETGWQRIDDRDSKISYIRGTTQSANAGSYNATMTGQMNPVNIDILWTFKFFGTKLRVFLTGQTLSSNKGNITIDGVTEPISFVGNPPVLSYEKVGLTLGFHTVTIYTLQSEGSINYYNLDCIDIDSTGYLTAQIGQVLTTPEIGWQRIDDNDSRILYDTNSAWSTSTLAGYYNSTRHFKDFGGTNSFVKFKFSGTKLRIIGLKNTTTYSNSIVIKIDGVSESFSVLGSSVILQCLLYEKTGLSNGIHSVEIDGLTSGLGFFLLDAIDIDSTGYLAHPILTQKSDITNMQIGDCILCRYTATSGAVGTFSELGTSVASEIPPTSSATPNGLFYFVKADKGLLVADRVVQHSISWDTLNTGGYIEGTKGIMVDKVSDPIVLPTGSSDEAVFSSDGVYMAMAHSNSPYVTIYKKSGDTFTKLADPSVLPTGNAVGISFSSDGVYLAVAHNITPYITIYKKSGDTFTKLADPSGLPTGAGWSVAFSPDGTYMAVGTQPTPFLYIYKRSGDTFTKLTNPTTMPIDAVGGISFSPDGVYMAVATSGSPYLIVYKRSGDTFTKLTNPTTLPTGAGMGVSFSPDGVYLAVTNTATPYIAIYKRSEDTFTKLADPSSLPSGTATGVAFSQDGKYMSVSSYASPYVFIYKRNGDTFTKLANPSVLPTSLGLGVAFSPDGNSIVVPCNNSPYVNIYKKSGENYLVRSLSGGVSYVDYTSKRIVSLLLHGDGTDGSTSFVDSSPFPKVITRNGSAVIKTDNYKFGGSSMYFNGSSSISLPANSDFNFGAEDFTIDFDIKRDRIATDEYPFGTSDLNLGSTSISLYMNINPSNIINVYVYSGTTSYILTSSTPLDVTNKFYHVAISRKGTTLYLFIDGVQCATKTIGTASINSSSNSLYIGKLGDVASTYFKGYIDEFRIIKGIAEYTANFTPPTSPYVEKSNTFTGALSSTTDKGLGAFPPNNEWDKYIANSDLGGKITISDDNVWHWSNLYTFAKETCILSLGANTYRIYRGKDSSNKFYMLLSSTADTTHGFRPILEYIESDGSSKETNLWY